MNLDSEIGILSYLSFVQDVQLKAVLSDMIKVKNLFKSFEFLKIESISSYLK